jgi:hypothetical protein
VTGPHAYRERLWPSLGVWLVVPLLAVTAAVAVLPVSTTWAVVAATAVVVALAGWAVRASLVVAVDDEHLVAGRARLPLRYVGEVEAWRGEEARAQRGPLLDARAHLVLRGWVGPVVTVRLTDPEDPTPYWVVSTRHPERLRDTLVGAPS